MRRMLMVLATVCACAQTPLTLAEAQRLALEKHPALEAARLGAQATGERVRQNEAARRPFAGANLTGAGAPDGDRVAAGGLNNPVIYSRLAMGVTVNQLVADFGRTTQLVASARAATEAENARVKVTRADILLNVQRAYFAALRSRAVVGIAQSTVTTRRVVVDQVTALVNAQLKSGLDLSFASTNLAEAQLLLSTAMNEFQAAQALLAEAMGLENTREFTLTEEPMPPAETMANDALAAEALRDRPELVASRLDTDASRRFALAEQALKYPTISAIATAGVIPAHVHQLSSNYIAGGVNVTLPFLNGGLYRSRQREAELRAQQAERRVKQLENAVSRDVALALLDVRTAQERIALTRQLIDQTKLALELAQSRYDLGLGSFVEVSQAQLAMTNAEIQNTSARYEYQLRRAVLDYRAGRL